MSKDEEIQQLRERLARIEGERDVYREMANKRPIVAAPYYPYWNVQPYTAPRYPYTVTISAQTTGGSTGQSSSVFQSLLSSPDYASQLSVGVMQD